MSGPVLVGVDGSPASLEAVDAAAQEARRWGRSLRVVHAATWPAMNVPFSASSLTLPEGEIAQLANRTITEAVERARRAEPGLEVTEDVVTGEALAVLEAESRTASLVVVGSRGLGGFTGLLLGSVAVHLSSHAACPVLVIRGQATPGGPVVLGADGSRDGDAAVRFAFAEASMRGADLEAVHTWNNWTGPVTTTPGELAPLVYDVDMLRDEEERVLSQAVSGYQERYPEVTVRPRLENARTRQALIKASENAQLLVVGARGRGGFTGLLLGSVSQAVLHHAHCPVAVVRRISDTADDDE
ncbi:universal stress protein [Streptomyces sp. AJS327]|uniref:universal stress protein n=1 Tax=Streptomyces sp. AJS327 TaxID=2545265 RepID=UPI0015DE85EB|nr:universal stress protein [Streptomyces sp. AJS327]MBA0051168.1 universal stress protein [Streptomyces sp. AJS327]